jgi:hypothetical protein
VPKNLVLQRIYTKQKKERDHNSNPSPLVFFIDFARPLTSKRSIPKREEELGKPESYSRF